MSNESVIQYNIHDRLTIESNDELPIPDFFASRGAVADGHLTFERRSSLPAVADERSARKLGTHRYWFADGTLTVRYPGPKQVAVQLVDLDTDRATVRYTPSFRSRVDFGNLFEGLLTYKLLAEDIALVHAAGICDEEGATLLTSMGRMGKTSTTLRLLDERNLGFMGDNVILVDTAATAYAWPATIGVFPGTLLRRSQLPPDQRRRALAKQIMARSELLSALLFHKFGIDLSENVDPTDLGIDVVERCQLDRCYILNGGRPGTGIYPQSVDAAVPKIATGTDMELDPSNYYLSLYAFVSDVQSIHPSSIVEKRRIVLSTALADTPIFEARTNELSGYRELLTEEIDHD